MYGMSSSGKEAINKIVEDIFDNIAMQLIGDIPQLRDKKRLIISSEPHMGLAHLFVQAMKNKTPNATEQDVLKSLLSTSYSHIESLKNKAKANLSDRLDGLAREAQLQRRNIHRDEMFSIVEEEFKKAKSGLEAIAEYESTKLRNLGTMMDITRMASSAGESDPTVRFIVVRDNVTCHECIRLHLMPDGVTPRLWKLSELKQSYHKRSDDVPSAFGEHPFCRCTLSYVTLGFGYDKTGKLIYVADGFDAYSAQRK